VCMEKRTIEQVKIYYFVMNPVTDRAEYGSIAMMSYDRDKLIAAYHSEYVERYQDDRFQKVFRQGGPLEWYNPIWDMDQVDSFGHGLYSFWVDQENLNSLIEKHHFIK
jgi:hypothetical protein